MPIGLRAHHWVTVAPERTVLVVAHNVTTLTRLLDILPAFDSDFRVQMIFSWSGTDPFHRGLGEKLEQLGIITISWEQATNTRFDLAITASHHGGLTDLNAPIVILSHGIGYTKYSPGSQGARERQTFGLSAQWLLYDGAPIADALVLSHPEQLERLAASAPPAAPAAVIAGDPCYDRILASKNHRNRYRAALGAGPERTIIAVSSTWWTSSLFGSQPDLIRRLLSELPHDSYQVVAILHPNIRHGHGEFQIRTWLAQSLRSGLILIPEMEGWRAGLIAADVVIGDHGSVTAYGAALDKPVLLAAFPQDDVAIGSPVDLLGKLAPRVDLTRPLRAQVDRAIADHEPGRYADVADLVTAVPGESLRLLRTLFYRLLDLAEPDGEPPVTPLDITGLTTAPLPAAMFVHCELDDRAATSIVSRFPAEAQRGNAPPENVHLVSHIDCPARSLRAGADILLCYESELIGNREDWLRDTLRQNTGCTLAAIVGRHQSLIAARDGRLIEVTGDGPDEVAAAYPSVVYSLLATRPHRAITLAIGDVRQEITLRPA